MRTLSALAAFVLSGSAAQAGDASTLDILGFTADARMFAFEEYGVQDGSGFPYANRFYIDVAGDKFMPGTPIRIRLETDGATVAQAREQARAKGQAVAPDAVLEAHRGDTVGANAITEISADPHRMTVNPRPVFPPVSDALEFRMEHVGVDKYPEFCRDTGGGMVGFRLSMTVLVAGQTARTLHEDTSVPQSRGCPLAYRIGAVQTFYPEDGEPSFAVLVAIQGIGFEGPDHRWMAVTGKLPQ